MIATADDAVPGRLGYVHLVIPSFLRRGDRLRLVRERERVLELETRLAASEERSRIARELHDVLAHSVSVMTVQTSGVRRRLLPEQEREREALQAVEETGRQALAEMRRLLGALREEHEVASRAPAPGLTAVGELVEQRRRAGARIDLSVEGAPVKLPTAVDLSAYRIVQEALARDEGSRAWVTVRYGAREVELEVAHERDAGGANGLAGLRERVALCGGELESGPRREGGYRVAARLPVKEHR